MGMKRKPMQGIIDFHAHAFPDEVAASAIPYLEEEGDVKAIHDGRVFSLLNLMDRDSVEKSVICSIATKPSQPNISALTVSFPFRPFILPTRIW
jgi:hypothetical protein